MSGLLTYSQYTSHPIAPTVGNHHLYFYSDGKLYRMDSSGTPVEVGAAGGGGGGTTHAFVRKSADESVTSSATLQNDDVLLFAIAASEVWIFEFVIVYTASSTGDIAVALAVPTGFSTLKWYGQGLIAAAWSQTQPVTASDTQKLFDGVGGRDDVVTMKGIIVNGATSGNVQFRWAQSVSDATATTVRAGSYLMAHQIA